MVKLKLCLFVIWIISTFNACRKDCPCQDVNNPDCENYNPCYGKQATADFSMQQYNGQFVDPAAEKPEFCDTIRMNGVSFTALMPSASSYSWKIGSDTRVFTGKKLELLFDSYIQDTNNINVFNRNYYQPIPVTLIIRNKASSCVPENDTLLSKTKNLVFARETPWLGTYRGMVEGQERVVKLEFFLNEKTPLQKPTYRLVNLPNLVNKDTLLILSGAAGSWTKLRSFKNYWWDSEANMYPFDNINNLDISNGICGMKIFVQPTVDGHDYISIEYRSVTRDNQQVKIYKFTGNRQF